jgi:hypothetical protein
MQMEQGKIGSMVVNKRPNQPATSASPYSLSTRAPDNDQAPDKVHSNNCTYGFICKHNNATDLATHRPHLLWCDGYAQAWPLHAPMCQDPIHQHSVDTKPTPLKQPLPLGLQQLLHPTNPQGPEHPHNTPNSNTKSRSIAVLTCSGAIVMPKLGRGTRPCAKIWSTSPRTVSMGMAKPTPLKEPIPPCL